MSIGFRVPDPGWPCADRASSKWISRLSRGGGCMGRKGGRVFSTPPRGVGFWGGGYSTPPGTECTWVKKRPFPRDHWLGQHPGFATALSFGCTPHTSPHGRHFPPRDGFLRALPRCRLPALPGPLQSPLPLAQIRAVSTASSRCPVQHFLQPPFQLVVDWPRTPGNGPHRIA